ncbi:MAG TPA: hypothetical protein H9815_01990 [Candidatus Ruania gallistercoris]|uniref:Uncharacterized protein n=1 Tax=Candidatus Ruania gallistercoris TaxID=2838746 RepID=A0A9D2J2G6_9MICO|nr:hypothetical protein [Candidatus Ruania gallistercoris]
MDVTELRPSHLVPALFASGAAVLGTGIGFAAPSVAGWLAAVLDASPIPVPQLLEVLAVLPLTWSVPAGVLLGLVGAGFLAFAIVHEGLKLTVDEDHLEHRQEDREGWIEREQVASIYPDGGDVVVLDRRTRLLVRLDADGLRRTELVRALREHGYPWQEEDPFEADYQRWMDGRPGFTAAEHRLIGTWREVRTKKAERVKAEAALREAGLVVRERDDRVQVRRAEGARDGAHRRPEAT